MTVVTLRPDAVWKQTGPAWTNVGGAASLNAAVADNLDTTYIADAAGGLGEIHYYIGTTALPANAVIKKITPRVRGSQAVGTARVYCSVYATAVVGISTPETYRSPLTSFKFVPAITTITGTAGGYYTGATFGGFGYKTPQDIVNNLVVSLKNIDTIGQDHRIYEVYVDVEYDEAPVASNLVLNPSTAATKTLTPTIEWDYIDAEGGPEAEAQLAVWATSDTTDGNFPASNPFVDSFVRVAGSTATVAYRSASAVTAGANSHTLAIALVNGTAYKAYVKSADAPNGVIRYGPVSTALSFTMAVTPPPVPAAPTATAELASYRVKLDLVAAGNLLSADDADLETTVGTWVNYTNATVTRDATVSASGAASLKLVAVAAATTAARTGELLPVTVGQQYMALATFRAVATSRSCRVGIRWLNAALGEISVAYGATVADSVGSFGTQNTAGPTFAPALSVWAELVVEVQAAALGEVHNVDRMSIAPGSSTTWSPGGQVAGRLVQVQRSFDGVYWFDIPKTWPLVALGSENNQKLTTYDTLIASGRTPRYRWRTSWFDTAIGLTILSDWSAVTTMGVATTLTTFALRDPDDETLFVTLPISSGDWEDDSSEQVGVFEPINGGYAIVVSAGINPRHFQGMQATFRDVFGSIAFKNLRSTRKALLFLTDQGDWVWVHFGASVHHRTVRNPSRKNALTRVEQFDFELIECAAPTGLPQAIY